MHMDNPDALASIMINDLLGENLPVYTLEDQKSNFATLRAVQGHQGDQGIVEAEP